MVVIVSLFAWPTLSTGQETPSDPADPFANVQNERSVGAPQTLEIPLPPTETFPSASNGDGGDG